MCILHIYYQIHKPQICATHAHYIAEIISSLLSLFSSSCFLSSLFCYSVVKKYSDSILPTIRLQSFRYVPFQSNSIKKNKKQNYVKKR
jgi:hypothetical protein